MKINHRHFWLALGAMSLMAQVPSAHAFTASFPVRATPGIGITSLPIVKIPVISIRPGTNLNPVTTLGAAPLVLAPAPAVIVPLITPVITPVIIPVVNPISKVILPGLFNPNSPIKLPGKPGSQKQALRLNALFDGAAKPQPEAVPVDEVKEEPQQPAGESGESHLTLPEWDLAQEIGI